MTCSFRSSGTTMTDLWPNASIHSRGTRSDAVTSSTTTGPRVSMARALMGARRGGSFDARVKAAQRPASRRPSANWDVSAIT